MRTPARGLFAVALLTLALAASPLHADTLWYNGDDDGVDGFANAVNGAWDEFGDPDAFTYDNFIVPAGEQWTVDTVWSNNTFNYAPAISQAHWEIRAGMSEGNGGSLLYSGDDSATATNNSGLYTVEVTGLSLTLDPGTYWLSVTPRLDGDFGHDAYVRTTSGANAIGRVSGDEGGGLLNLPLYNINYSQQGYDYDFSMGVGGTSEPVPEPASVVFWVTALAGAAFKIRKRRARRR